MDHAHHRSGSSRMQSRLRLVLPAVPAVAALLLWEEHQAHVLGALPYALLLLCPLMHLFMHAGHGKHGKDGGEAP